MIECCKVIHSKSIFILIKYRKYQLKFSNCSKEFNTNLIRYKFIEF